MKSPAIQQQHIIPDVYLKQFSFTTSSNHQKIKVIKKGETGIQEVFVKSFNRVGNFFDIESEIPEIERVFEEYHGPFETNYPKILEELTQKKSLSDKHYSLLLQFVGNIISRSTRHREEILYVLNSDAKANFIKDVIEHAFETQEEIDNIEKSDLFRNYYNLAPDKLINRILMHLNEYLWRRLLHFEIIFFNAPQGKSWFTTNNPVVLENYFGKFNFLLPESEIYFPLSLQYLAFLHCPQSKNKSNNMRTYKENLTYDFPNNSFDELTKKIISNCTDYVVCPPVC